MRKLSLTILAAAVLAASPLAAQDDAYRGARVRYVEPGAWIQLASEPQADQAVANFPFLPGDRLWTDEQGRVELQFEDGTLVRVGSRSKLDLGSTDDRGTTMSLWAGTVQLTEGDWAASGTYTVLVPDGRVEVEALGATRIDVREGDTRVTVNSGEATLETAGRAVRIRGGERAFAYAGREPGPAEQFDPADRDSFAQWSDERDAQTRRAAYDRSDLPYEIYPYASELDTHGSWYVEVGLGRVWRPQVAAGWQPYTYGRWVWTPYGWTWVADEPWGWAVSHYGRWGYTAGLGWYWLPGRVWSPAWVWWAVGPRYVGWCPLGHRDRPVVVPWYKDQARRYAVPRDYHGTSAAWVYADRGTLGRRAVARPSYDRDVLAARDVSLVKSPGSILDRSLRVAAPRTVAQPALGSGHTKPLPGDTVPELRHDPFTTIPVAGPRRTVRPREDALDVRSDDRGKLSLPVTSARPRPYEPVRSEPDRPVTARPAAPGAPRVAPLTRPPESAPVAKPSPQSRPSFLDRVIGSAGEARDRAKPSSGSYSPPPSDRGASRAPVGLRSVPSGPSSKAGASPRPTSSRSGASSSSRSGASSSDKSGASSSGKSGGSSSGRAQARSSSDEKH